MPPMQDPYSPTSPADSASLPPSPGEFAGLPGIPTGKPKVRTDPETGRRSHLRTPKTAGKSPASVSADDKSVPSRETSRDGGSKSPGGFKSPASVPLEKKRRHKSPASVPGGATPSDRQSEASRKPEDDERKTDEDPPAHTSGDGEVAPWDHITSEAATEPAEKVAAPPLLRVGSRFDKCCPLKPNRWVKIGRSNKAQLLLKNSGVSRNHCSLRWDPHQRAVELCDTSNAGTFVNGEILKNSRRKLAHGDRIRIDGKGLRFDFLLDLRPVGLGFCDPRQETPGPQQDKAATGPSRRRDTLRAQLEHIETAIKSFDGRAFEKEKEFYEIVTRRRSRILEDQEREESVRKYLRGTEQLQKELQEGREAWLLKLKATAQANDDIAGPMLAETGVLQVKIEKLQLKKVELERTLHPERYALADVAIGEAALNRPEETTQPQITTEPDDPNIVENFLSDTKVPTSPLKTRPRSQDGDLMSLKGEPEQGGGDGEEPAARSAHGSGSAKRPKKTGGHSDSSSDEGPILPRPIRDFSSSEDEGPAAKAAPPPAPPGPNIGGGSSSDEGL